MSVHVIVVGNEKGGSGKSTVAMHLVAWLLSSGHRVGALDLDSRQRSLFRYLENRRKFANERSLELPMPEYRVLTESNEVNREAARVADEQMVAATIEDMRDACEYVVIDTPGARTYLSAAAHGFADTLITPLNDSFVDFDMLAQVDGASSEILGFSSYSQAVWEARISRPMRGLPPLNWLVMRNRISHIEARNQRRVRESLDMLSKRIGYRVVAGFSERVIFRELFLNGLTLLDISADLELVRFSMSHVAARQELRDLVSAIGLPADSVA